MTLLRSSSFGEASAKLQRSRGPVPLWSRWPALERRLAATKRLALFLDYDGTLVPLADHPSHARLPAGARQVLRQLAQQPGVRVALLSGRSAAELRQVVGVPEAYYVGNHGLEVQAPMLQHVNPVARATAPRLRGLAQRLTTALAPIRGAWVEDKGLTLSVHYRLVDDEEQTRVKAAVYGVLRPALLRRQVRVTTGHGVFEVRPPARWTKGTMLQWLLARETAMAPPQGAGQAGSAVLALCCGDDASDEDAFEALKGRGVTVAVGPSTPLTHARYVVERPADIQRMLRLILAARRRRRTHGG